MKLLRLSFNNQKPKGKMYSFRCNRCKEGFISSVKMEEPICGKCIQFIKSIDFTIDNEKICSNCGKVGVLYSKDKCQRCYFRP